MDCTALLLYVTMPDTANATALARVLVKERLAACVNILPMGTAIYAWEGNIAEDTECTLIVKTTDLCAESAKQRIIAHHPYDIPCMVALPVSETLSHEPYLRWLKDAIASPANKG